MLTLFRRGKKSDTSQVTEEKKDETHNDSIPTPNAEDDLFKDMDFLATSNDVEGDGGAAEELLPSVDTMESLRDLQSLDVLNTQQQDASVTEDDASSSKSVFGFINKGDVCKQNDDVKLCDQIQSPIPQDAMSIDQSLPPKPHDAVSIDQSQSPKPHDKASNETSEISAKASQSEEPSLKPTSWKPVKQQGKVKKVRKVPRPGMAGKSLLIEKNVTTTVQNEENKSSSVSSLSGGLHLEITESSLGNAESQKDCTKQTPAIPSTIENETSLTSSTEATTKAPLGPIATEDDTDLTSSNIDEPSTSTTLTKQESSLSSSTEIEEAVSVNTTKDITLETVQSEMHSENETNSSSPAKTIQPSVDILDGCLLLQTDNVNESRSCANEAELSLVTETHTSGECFDSRDVLIDNISVNDTNSELELQCSLKENLQIATSLAENGSSLDDTKNKFCLVLTESERLSVDVQCLRMKEQDMENDKVSLNSKRNELVEKWKMDSVDVDTVAEKIASLRERQTLFEEQEDYDQASEIDENVRELLEHHENFKYRHPLSDAKIVQLISEYEEQTSRHAEVEQEVLQAYQGILEKQNHNLVAGVDVPREGFEEEELRLKEERLTVERSSSHLALDVEHNQKNQNVLDEQVEKKTKDLTQQKENLLETKNKIQAEINELEIKLINLRNEESRCTEGIDEISHRIAMVYTEFQPRMEKLQEEQQRTTAEQSRLTLQMDSLTKKESEIQREKEKICEEREKNKLIIKELESQVRNLQCKTETWSGHQNLSLENFLQSVVRNDEDDVIRSKVEFEKIESEFKLLVDSVHSEEVQLNALKRSLNDLETRLTQLQKSKQTVVKEKKYNEAKRISAEMKTLTDEGEVKQREILRLEEDLKSHIEKMEQDKVQVEKAKEMFDNKLKDHDAKIVQGLQEMNRSIESYLSSNPDNWCESILNLQKSSNLNIIVSLCKKHGFCDEDLSPRTTLRYETQLKKEINDLEAELQHAEDTEDWDRAEQLHTEITSKKGLVTT